MLKFALNQRAACRAIELGQQRHLRDRVVHAVAEEAGDAVDDDLGHRTHARSEHRRSARHRLDRRQPEALGTRRHVDERERVAEQLVARLALDRAEELHARRHRCAARRTRESTLRLAESRRFSAARRRVSRSRSRDACPSPGWKRPRKQRYSPGFALNVNCAGSIPL